MKINNHKEITRAAIGELFSARALDAIITANIGQDALQYQIGHDHHHYDNNKFAESDAYVFDLRAECINAIQRGDLRAAWAALGKLTHTVQDFYAHSNYIELMLSDNVIPVRQPGSDLLIGLRSGKLYYPLEVITFFPGIPVQIVNLFPEDSHARLNKDDESRNLYAEARRLAIAASSLEVGTIIEHCSEEQKRSFLDRNPL